jgi:gamma-glutamyltranspeptidase/glutathione hydrolase
MDINKIEGDFHPTADSKAVEAQEGMVSTASGPATEAGVEMLKLGGNAMDAAAASAFALGVCENQASGMGGQSMMLIHREGKVIALDGSSRAPSLAHVSAIYKDDKSSGYRATTVPGTPAALWYAHNRYGKLPWPEILQPAIRLAKEGISITPLQHSLQKRELKQFLNVNSRSGARYFLKDNKPYEPGDLFRQPDLAAMLTLMAEEGIEEFYTGGIARKIDADMREHGGLLRYDDLALTPWPIERKALKRKYRGLTVYTMPLPGAGRTLLFNLLMLNQLPPGTFMEMADPFMESHLLAEVMRKAFLERFDRPYDPNFYPQLQLEERDMMRKKYARSAVKKILKNVNKTILSAIVSEDELSGETTHLSVMDRDGMAVSLTQSIERAYGSKAAAQGLGFLYNNYLMDFEYTHPRHPFYLRPNAVPWATVAPTLLFLDGRLWMALGSPGSERIISSLTQVLVHIVERNWSLDRAIAAPRLHCSLGGRISLEASRFPAGLVDFLKNKGYRIDKRDPYSFYLGCVQAVLKRQTGPGYQGVADPRRDGTVLGI